MKTKTGGIRDFTSSFAFRMIIGIVLWLTIFTICISTIGYVKFTESLTREYNDSAFRTAETAVTLVDGNKIDEYLQKGFDDADYADRWNRMNVLCQKQNVTLIYVIKVDTSDYKSFLSVFNTVNNSSTFSPWDVGFFRKTTNEQYEKIYRDIYENGLTRGTITRTSGLNGRDAHITSLIPVKTATGEVSAIMCVERPMEELRSGRQEYLNSIFVATVILTVLSGFILALYLRKQFVKPIEQISAEATRFAKENSLAGEGSIVRLSNIKELRMLAGAIEKMEDDTVHYMKDLTKATAERERISIELGLATTIQANILPNTFPPYPHRKDFEIFASMNAAKEVGGDFYDFFLLDNDRLGFVVADVSGKGVPAALFMMRAKMIIKSLAESGKEVDEIMTEANATLCEGNEAGMFVTSWLGIADMRTGTLSYTNAGHNPPLIRHKNGTFEYIRTRPNFILAGMDGVRYRKNEIKLLPGDEIFIYTDGVTEATDSDNNLFGEERLRRVINLRPDEGVETRCKGVQAAIDTFVGEAEQFDDITMLSLTFHFFQNYENITTGADAGSSELVRDFIHRRTRKLEISPKAINKAQIIVDEIYSNIYLYSGASMAQVAFSIENDKITLVFKDNGMPYDPLATADPDVTLSAAERKIGGLGIFMVKKMASALNYAYEDGYNILTVTVDINA